MLIKCGPWKLKTLNKNLTSKENFNMLVMLQVEESMMQRNLFTEGKNANVIPTNRKLCASDSCSGMEAKPCSVGVLPTQRKHIYCGACFTDKFGKAVPLFLFGGKKMRNLTALNPVQNTTDPAITKAEKAALLDDLYNQISSIRDLADGLIGTYRAINIGLNKIGNVASILNSSGYKERRLKEVGHS